MKFNENGISLGISLIAFLVAIVAICRTCPRTDLSFDYLGLIIGVLSVLVTVLVGLNIYALVDFRKKEDIIDKKMALITESLLNLNKSELANEATTENTIAFIYYSLMGFKDPTGLEYRYVYHSILSLEKASQLGEIDTCNAIVKALRETITQPEEISMSRENKENIYGWLVQVKDPMRIEGFGELMELIARIKSS